MLAHPPLRAHASTHAPDTHVRGRTRSTHAKHTRWLLGVGLSAGVGSAAHVLALLRSWLPSVLAGWCGWVWGNVLTCVRVSVLMGGSERCGCVRMGVSVMDGSVSFGDVVPVGPYRESNDVVQVEVSPGGNLILRSVGPGVAGVGSGGA